MEYGRIANVSMNYEYSIELSKIECKLLRMYYQIRFVSSFEVDSRFTLVIVFSTTECTEWVRKYWYNISCRLIPVPVPAPVASKVHSTAMQTQRHNLMFPLLFRLCFYKFASREPPTQMDALDFWQNFIKRIRKRFKNLLKWQIFHYIFIKLKFLPINCRFLINFYNIFEIFSGVQAVHLHTPYAATPYKLLPCRPRFPRKDSLQALMQFIFNRDLQGNKTEFQCNSTFSLLIRNAHHP